MERVDAVVIGAGVVGLAVARSLAEHPSLVAALHACGIAPTRHRSFATAFSSLLDSEVIRER